MSRPRLRYPQLQALDEADKIVKAAIAAGRSLTDAERATVKTALANAEADAEDNRLADEIEAFRRGDTPDAVAPKSAFADTLTKSGWNLRSQPSVALSAWAALDAGRKAPTLPAAEDFAPVTAPGIANMGRDGRYLWPFLVRQDAGVATSVSDFRQVGSRTITGSAERAIDATTDKAELDLELEHVVEPLKQLAVLISNVPNALLEAAPLLRQFLDSEGRHAVEQALDSHVLSQIVAASPSFGNTGTGLVQQVRNAVTAMRAEGANPSLLVLNAADAASLDLYEDTAGSYVFPLRDSGSASPLFGLRVVERPGTTPPYLIDPNMLGLLYLGGMRFDADPFTKFSANLTNLRVETSALLHVRQPAGAYRIAAS